MRFWAHQSANALPEPTTLIPLLPEAGSMTRGWSVLVTLKGDSYRLKDRDLGRVPNDDAG